MNFSFPHLYGHQDLKDMWMRLYEDNRMPHTMLFYGDEGVGKTTAALSLAGLLTNQDSKLWQELNEITLEEVSGGTISLADDLVWYLRPEKSELKIDQFREVLNQMITFDDRTHVCIIDEAQTMRETISNALLKTLEEPRSNLYFILVTHDINMILPTIISRSERFPFFPLKKEEFNLLLNSDKKKYNLSSEMDLDTLYHLTEGKPGVALEIIESKDKKQPETALHFWETISKSESPFSDLHEEKWKDRKAFAAMLRWIILVGRDIMVLAEVKDLRLIHCRQVADEIEFISRHWTEGKAVEALGVLEEAQVAVNHYINVNVVWDAVLIQLEYIRKGNTGWSKS